MSANQGATNKLFGKAIKDLYQHIKQTNHIKAHTHISDTIPSPIGTHRARQIGDPPLAITPRHM